MKEEKIKVLALLPMELPKEIELDNTLEAMQKFVGGLIECITLNDTGSEVTLVCNDVLTLDADVQAAGLCIAQVGAGTAACALHLRPVQPAH